MNQKGFTQIVVIFIFLLLLAGAYYLGFRSGNLNLPSAPNPSPALSPSPQQPSTPTSQSTSTPQTANVQSFDYASFFAKKFPTDMPVYPGAKMADSSDNGAVNQGACMEELLKKDPQCLRVNFKFTIPSKAASVENIVNWYVGNPNASWTYRGVYGDQRDYQFGDIYNKQQNVYYKMEYRYPNQQHSDIEIYYNGPFPLSDLSPKP